MRRRLGKILGIEEGILYAASRRTVMTFFVENAAAPVLYDSLRLLKNIDAMRVHGSFLYLDMKQGEKTTIIAADPGDLVIDGAHEVSWWVRGQEIVGDRVYLLDGNRLKIAQVVPAGGWIW